MKYIILIILCVALALGLAHKPKTHLAGLSSDDLISAFVNAGLDTPDKINIFIQSIELLQIHGRMSGGLPDLFPSKTKDDLRTRTDLLTNNLTVAAKAAQPTKP